MLRTTSKYDDRTCRDDLFADEIGDWLSHESTSTADAQSDSSVRSGIRNRQRCIEPSTAAIRTRTVASQPQTLTEPKRLRRIMGFLLLSLSILGSAFCLFQGWKTSHEDTIPIAELRPGDRVVMGASSGALDAADRDLPDDGVLPDEQVNPSTWKLVRLRAEIPWDDGTIDDINVESLQPPEWFAYHDVHVGGTAPIPLDLVEMGLPENLMAKVLAIERCPPIEDGPGRIVLTTVNHLNADLMELTVEAQNGDRETFRPTGTHKFYCQSDDTWVSTSELGPGDILSGTEGNLTVVSANRLPGTHRVYNMTVQGEHVYHVSSLGVLAHNTMSCRLLSDQAALRQGLAARSARVNAGNLRGARPYGINGRPGHPHAHGVSYADHANNINNAQRKFIGVNRNGRPVNIFYRDGNVTITDGDDVTRIITGYGRDSTKAVSPSKWLNDPQFHEILD